jgi:hypothetical protein
MHSARIDPMHRDAFAIGLGSGFSSGVRRSVVHLDAHAIGTTLPWIYQPFRKTLCDVSRPARFGDAA